MLGKVLTEKFWQLKHESKYYRFTLLFIKTFAETLLSKQSMQLRNTESASLFPAKSDKVFQIIQVFSQLELGNKVTLNP